ncbi:FG-GAP-like repeat-containing protein [Longibacter sp.]|uniref:FG-GAP-like repeat-containing protein n=1 Tax=Longibacter sp. TaxID=2045415 RepID=UPI003EB89CB9
MLLGCSSPFTAEPENCFARSVSSNVDSIAGIPFIRWHPTSSIPDSECGNTGGSIEHHHNLTSLYGETEFTRNAQFVDINQDGRREIITRTLNENQVRALNSETGSTLWVSPFILPASHHPQASDLVVADLDEDGQLEILIVTYDGHVLCINAENGSLQWRRQLPYHINNPDLASSVGNITDDPGREVALTVGTDVEWGPRSRPRINQIQNPSVVVLQADGSISWTADQYDSTNSNGHRTWVHDVDGDGFSEVFAIGQRKVLAFDRKGTIRFAIPMENAGHPDQIVFGNWTDEHPGDEIIYTDGIHAIGVASSSGERLELRRVRGPLGGHLQDLTLVPTPEGPHLLAQNIRDSEAKTVLYDQDLNPRWASQLGYHASMQTTRLIDWDEDGQLEIATGSISETGDKQCSLQVMEIDGAPLYWHRWNDYRLCVITDATEEALLVGVGWNEGSEGRYSLPDGVPMNLFVMNTTNP